MLACVTSLISQNSSFLASWFIVSSRYHTELGNWSMSESIRTVRFHALSTYTTTHSFPALSSEVTYVSIAPLSK